MVGTQIREDGDDRLLRQQSLVRLAAHHPVQHRRSLGPGQWFHGAEGAVLKPVDPAPGRGLRHRLIPGAAAGHVRIAAGPLFQLRIEAGEHQDKLPPAHGRVRLEVPVPLEIQNAPGGQERHGVVVPFSLVHPRDRRPVIGPVPEKAVIELAALRHGQVGVGPDGTVPVSPHIGGMGLRPGEKRQNRRDVRPLFRFLPLRGENRRSAQQRQTQEQGDQTFTPHSLPSLPRFPGRYIP